MKVTELTREIQENKREKSNHVNETGPRYLYGVLTAMSSVHTSHLFGHSLPGPRQGTTNSSHMIEVNTDPT